MGFKMKGNPMARNFGIGNSPIKQKTKKVGQENEIPWEDVDKHHQEALRRKKMDEDSPELRKKIDQNLLLKELIIMDLQIFLVMKLIKN